MKKVLLLFVLFISICSYGQRNALSAKSFVQDIADQKYQDALLLTDSSFQSQVTAAQLQQAWTGLLLQVGRFQKIDSTEEIKVAADAGFSAWKVYSAFEKAIQPLAISFNTANEITGFSFGNSIMKQTDTAKPAFPEKSFSLTVSDGTLKGTIMLPADSNPHPPVALIIAGSGPTDRDGNAVSVGLHSNTYKLLAEALAKNGIASLRYDKRHIGESNDFTKGESEITFDDFVKDANSINHYLQTETTFSRVYIIGHSEGSLIGILASEKLQPKAFISLAGAGENIAETLKKQLAATPYAAQADSILAQLTRERAVRDIPEGLDIFRPSVQPFLISMFKYAPQKEIAKLKCPVLIIQGTTDLQIKTADAEQLKQGNPSAKLVIADGMNHVLKDAPADKTKNIATYKDPTAPLNTVMVKAIVDFIRDNK